MKFIGPKSRLENMALLFSMIIKVIIIKLALLLGKFLISSN
jgi:hypothetical protein